MGLVVEESRSIIKSRKSVGDMTEPCGTPELIGNFVERAPKHEQKWSGLRENFQSTQ